SCRSPQARPDRLWNKCAVTAIVDKRLRDHFCLGTALSERRAFPAGTDREMSWAPGNERMTHRAVCRPVRCGEAGRGPVAVGTILALTASSASAQTQGGPSGAAIPPAAAPLARYVPRQHLAFFLEFDGLDSHKDAWRESAAHKLLNETSSGALLEDLCVQA